MNHLPEDVITTIFEHLDNESLFNTLLASKHLADIFASSSRLLLMFNLFVGPATIDIILKNKSIENIPFKNVTLYNFARKISPEMQEFLDKFSHSIEILIFEHIEFESVEDFSLALSHLPNLKSLHLKTCYVDHSEPQILQPISNLKSITFDDCRGSLFPFFKNQQSIEKVSIIRKPWTFGLFYSDFNEMASNLPNLKHLVFGGPKTADYFNYGEYPFKIQTLEAYSVTSSRTESVSKFDFLKSQQESLKELTIHKLPYNYDGGEVLKFIIEEMRLEKFYFGKVPLILDGKKQEVKELTVSEVYLTSAFEMFLQFPSIQSFSLLLTKTDIDESRINDIINHNTDIFKNLNVLNVTDYSGSLNRPSKFISLYKNFKNIAKLTLKTNCNDLNEILSESLSYFTDLTEINLTAGEENSVERLRIVKNLVPNLKKLGVSKDVVKDAEKIFGNDVDIIRLDDFDGDNYRNEEQIEAFWMREKF